MGDLVLKDLSLSRLDDRRKLLDSVDRFRRHVDGSDAIESADVSTKKAFEILTSRQFVEALDISREDPKVRELYGQGQDRPGGDGAPLKNEQFLAARRLVQAGVRCVTLAYGFWDFHSNNTRNLKRFMPMLDGAVSGLIQDLHQQGMEKDVTVLVWGDFGRTPTINKDAGRDHWPKVASCLLAGGGMRTGQIIGSTTPDGGEADDRPIHYRDVLATILHNMGIDVRSETLTDNLGRPQYVLAGHEPIAELI